MTDYSDIIRRLEEAEGPSRLTDANILWAFYPEAFEADAGEDDDHLKSSYCYGRGGWTLNRADRMHLDMIPVPKFTGSIDATVALVENVLPGWECERTVTASGTFIRLVGPEYIRYDFMGERNPHKSASIAVRGRDFSRPDAIALLIAMFRALQETRHD